MKQSKRLIGLLLAVVMLLSMVPVTFAADTASFSDFPTGWSKEAMTAAVNNGLLNGFEDGKIHPEANLTRAQFAAIMARAFGAKTKANISDFADVSVSAWYYDDIAKAVKMGALKGQSATEMAPDSPITRQEVFTAFARILVLSDDDTAALDKFNDKGEIASWAINHMAALTERGYVNGDPEGNVNPEALISREEFAQLMHNSIRTYITKAGTYTDDLDGIVVVRVGDVTLKGLKNSSDLVIGDGAGEGKIFIESVDIEKRLLARGGTIKVSKSTLGDFVVVNNVNGVTKFENYRDEKFFKGIVENTTAKFLTRGGGGTPVIPSDTVYTLTLKNEDGSDYCTVTVRNGVVTGYIGDPTKDYYTFDGWYDSGDNKITNFATVTATQELTAKFAPVPYNVTFESEDGVPDFHWTGTYVAPTSFTVEDFTLPTFDKVAAPLGYIFEGWSYNGTQIENIEQLKNAGLPTTAGNITIKAEFTLKEYTIVYVGVTWKDGYLPQTTYTIENASLVPLAISEKIANVPAGQEFKYWKLSGTNTKIASIPDVTVDTPDVLMVEPHYELIGGGGDTVYTLTLKREDGSDYCTVIVTNGVVTGYIGDPTKDYYTFDGWYDSGDNKITNFATVTATQELTAKFAPITYTVKFVNGSTTGADLVWKTGYTPVEDFTIENIDDVAKALPTEANMDVTLGYRFVSLKHGNETIASLRDIVTNGDLPVDVTAEIEIVVNFELIWYSVAYQNVTWKEGCEPTVLVYNLLTVDSYTLPQSTDVVAPTDYEFKYWKDASTGVRVDVLTITEDTPDVITLTPHFELIPIEPVTVTFYRIYSELPPFKIGEPLSIQKGSTVDKAAFPDATAYVRKGYVEDANIAAVYKDNEYTHTITPEFWYVKDGVMTPFDETVAVNENTSVYVLSKALSLMLTYEYDGKVNALSVSADYNKDTRVMNSIKDIIAKSGRQQLELALAEGLIPNYDEMVGKVVDKLESTGLLEVDGDEKKIQIVKVPFKVSTFVKEDVANGMIKQYLRDVVNNPEELDKIFSMIDVAEFADQLGIDTIIANMSNAEIASLMKSSDHKGDIIDFVYSDLQKTDSSMMNFVIDYVTNDEDFRNKIIDQIIAELKDKTKTSTLKTKALTYIEGQLKNPESAFYAKFVAMVKADLQSPTSVVMDAVVSYVRTNLKADTQEGKDLRKEILTNTELLKEFLANDKMKAEIIKLILRDTFIDKALNNVDFRTVLVEAVMDDDDFIDMLLASSEFHDYIIDQLHPVDGDASAHPLAKDVEDLIQDKESKFRKYVLDLVKQSSAFTGLFATHPELESVMLAEFEWSDFVADDNDFLKYAFRQSGVTGSYTFVSLNDIDAKIAESYNALSDLEKYALTESTDEWNSLSDAAKQKVRNELYRNDEAKAEVIAEAKNKFNSYKADIVDKITEGKISEITDETAIKLIDELLVDYVTKYIEQEELHEDDAIDASIAGVIEEILFGFISDLIHGVHFDPELEDELATMLGHIDAIKHQFVVDPTPDVVARLKVIVKNYRDTHDENIENIINNNYTELTNKLISMIDPDATNSVYSEVESALISVADTIDATLIKGYVEDIDASDKANGTTKLDDLIKKYIKNVTVTDLNNYIAAFLYDSVNDKENTANVATVRAEIESFIADTNQADTVKEMAVTYITDSDNADTIKGAISDFIDDIDETFVNTNRTIIEDAIKNIDVTAFVDEQFIKDYVAGLDESKGEKTAFADQIFAALQSDADYTKFMKQLLNGDNIEVNKSNVSMVTAISGAIRGLSFESIIGFIDNAGIEKLMDIVGTDFIEELYNEMLKEYCDGLDAAINEVKESSDASIKKSYTTSLTLKMNVFTVYDKLYEKAIEKAIDKVENAGIYYNENIYLKFLVEHNVLDYILNGDLSLADGEFSGYSLKAELDYYDYLVMLLLVGDDALTWYGDEVNGLSDEQLDALYNAAFDKIFFVHEKVNEILVAFAEDGTLPAKIQSAIEGVSQLNNLILQYGETGKSLINRYLDSDINIKFEDESIAGEEKVLKLVDFIVGNDDPVINIDSVYALLFTFNDKIQSKLEAVVETDKFKTAVDKFESTSFGELFDGKGKLGTIGDKMDEIRNNGRVESALDSLYDMFYLLAYEGIDAFKVPNSEIEVTDSEIYRIKVGKVVMEVKRHYR